MRCSVIVSAALGAVFSFVSGLSAADGRDAAFERQRREISRRYHEELQRWQAVMNGANEDGVQLGWTMAVGDRGDLEERFYREISAWRLNSAATPLERQFVESEIRNVYCRHALYRSLVRYDKLFEKYEKFSQYGSAGSMLFGDLYSAIYEPFNRRMLLSAEELEKEVEAVRYPVRFTMNGKEYLVRVDAGIPFEMDFWFDGKFKRTELYRIGLQLAAECGGRKFAVFNIDKFDFCDSSGYNTLVAELRDGEWRARRMYMQMSIDKCEHIGDVLKLNDGGIVYEFSMRGCPLSF